LINHSFHYDLRKHFSARIVTIWKSLPNSIVDASPALLMHLKHGYISFGRTKPKKLDIIKYLISLHQAVKYDFTADLTTIRSYK